MLSDIGRYELGSGVLGSTIVGFTYHRSEALILLAPVAGPD
jgi:hypothetical protein